LVVAALLVYQFLSNLSPALPQGDEHTNVSFNFQVSLPVILGFKQLLFMD